MIITVYVRLLVPMMLAVCASKVVQSTKNQSVLQTARLMITSVCLNKKCVCCSLTLLYSILAAVKVCRNGLNLHFTVYLNQSTPVQERRGRRGHGPCWVFDVITFRYGRCFGQPTDEPGKSLTTFAKLKRLGRCDQRYALPPFPRRLGEKLPQRKRTYIAQPAYQKITELNP